MCVCVCVCVLLTVINIATIQPGSQMLSWLHLYHEVYLRMAQTIVPLAKHRFLPLELSMNKKNKIKKT